MKRLQGVMLAGLGLALAVPAAWAQEAPPGFREEFLGQFEASAGKLVSLAEAMPADSYGWSPGEGVMPVARVYMHIARYNYYYPQVGLGVEAPAGIDVEGLEEIGEKERVVELLRQSMEHVRRTVEQMPESRLSEGTRLYGREVARWAVLLQLLAHMNEHLGQSIAYARMNEVVPPWSR